MKRFKLLDRLEAEWNRCTECRDMVAHRSKVVHWRGNPLAPLAIVGEAPGADEDRIGLPFVGRSGQLLDSLIREAGLDPAEDVFVCNQLACRPPRNRPPKPTEIGACAPRLQFMIEKIVKPKCLLLLGMTAARLAGVRSQLGEHRGKLKSIEIPGYNSKVFHWTAIITYHPSFLLRNQQARFRAIVIGDIQLANGIARDYTVNLKGIV